MEKNNAETKNIEKTWPQSIINLAGAWKDFPTVEEIRSSEGNDIRREEF